jgi:hypothetical protein
MNGQRHSLLALVGVLALATGASAQTKPATPAAAQQPAAAPARLAPPVRGEAQVGFTKPVTKNDGKMITTTFKVKNLAAGSIAGLKIEVYYYDKKGDPVSGDTFRYRKPLQPNEVIDVELKVPVNKQMQTSNYKFEQANGTIKPKQMDKL